MLAINTNTSPLLTVDSDDELPNGRSIIRSSLCSWFCLVLLVHLLLKCMTHSHVATMLMCCPSRQNGLGLQHMIILVSCKSASVRRSSRDTHMDCMYIQATLSYLCSLGFGLELRFDTNLTFSNREGSCIAFTEPK